MASLRNTYDFAHESSAASITPRNFTDEITRIYRIALNYLPHRSLLLAGRGTVWRTLALQSARVHRAIHQPVHLDNRNF